jgi:hypothetical protein
MRISKPSSNYNHKTGFFNEDQPVYLPPPFNDVSPSRVSSTNKKNISGCYPILSTKYKRHKWHFLFFFFLSRDVATKINLKKDESFFINIKETFLDTLCLALLCTSLILGGAFFSFSPARIHFTVVGWFRRVPGRPNSDLFQDWEQGTRSHSILSCIVFILRFIPPPAGCN